MTVKLLLYNYFGGARSKRFATLRNVSAKSVGFWLYSANSNTVRISSKYLEITSISFIYSFFFFRGRKNYYFGFPGV